MACKAYAPLTVWKRVSLLEKKREKVLGHVYVFQVRDSETHYFSTASGIINFFLLKKFTQAKLKGIE